MAYWELVTSGTCCICGDSGPLTGEHRFKHSAMKAEFGSEATVLSSYGERRYRPIQGLRSQLLHFESRLCAPCNNERTQAADRAFDGFVEKTKEQLAHADRGRAFEMDEALFLAAGADGICLAQYFAKLICCHLADQCQIRWRRLTEFVLNSEPTVFPGLIVGVDPMAAEYRQTVGQRPYASSGGFGMTWSTGVDSIASLRSSRTFGHVRFIFWFRVSQEEQIALKSEHNHVWQAWRKAVFDSLDGSTNSDLARLGFT